MGNGDTAAQSLTSKPSNPPNSQPPQAFLDAPIDQASRTPDTSGDALAPLRGSGFRHVKALSHEDATRTEDESANRTDHDPPTSHLVGDREYGVKNDGGVQIATNTPQTSRPLDPYTVMETERLVISLSECLNVLVLFSVP